MIKTSFALVFKKPTASEETVSRELSGKEGLEFLDQGRIVSRNLQPARGEIFIVISLRFWLLVKTDENERGKRRNGETACLALFTSMNRDSNHARQDGGALCTPGGFLFQLESHSGSLGLLKSAVSLTLP
jgi:hypothetical protein